MRRNFRSSNGMTAFIGLGAITLFAIRPLARTATLSPIPDYPIHEFEARQPRVLYTLCRTLNRPCAQELALGDAIDDGKSPPIKFKNMRPKEILDSAFGNRRDYRWTLRDNILTVEPKTRTGEDLLARTLDHVSIRASSTYKAALTIFTQANIHVGQNLGGDPFFARVDLELNNVTVREALNALAKLDGQVMWSFHPIDLKKGKGNFNLSSWRKKGSGIRPYDDKLNLQ